MTKKTEIEFDAHTLLTRVEGFAAGKEAAVERTVKLPPPVRPIPCKGNPRHSDEFGIHADSGVLRMASGQAENAERSEREPDVEKNGMEEPNKEASENARRIYRGEKKLNEFAL